MLEFFETEALEEALALTDAAVSYQVLADDGTPMDAHFEMGDDTIVFHGGSTGRRSDARNVDYWQGLRTLLQRLEHAGHPIRDAWVDSNRVQSLPISARMILDATEAALPLNEQMSIMRSRMQSIGREPDASSDDGSLMKRIRLRIPAAISSDQAVTILRARSSKKDFRSERRLPVSELEKVTPEHLFIAVQRLLDGFTDHQFDNSTDYDVLLDNGVRLAPKQIFGIAASLALGHAVFPDHFTGGLGSPCFRILEAARYTIVTKGKPADPDPTPLADAEYHEGTPLLRTHLRRERASGLREAKKAAFRRTHGNRLFCERCGEDPVETYGTPSAESCIEVHHSTTQIAEMQDGHKTRLEDLQCLCANCHRLTHREIRNAGDTDMRGRME